jgi:hypothetical protein
MVCSRRVLPSLHVVGIVYPGYRQRDANVTQLREEDTYPAQPLETSVLYFGVLNRGALWFLGCGGEEPWESFLELTRCYS